MVYTSRWITVAEGVRIPGNLWIEVEGPGENLEEVLVCFANAGISALPVLSLAFNSAVHEAELEIGFETTPDVEEREYFQAYIPPERTIAHVTRLGRAELALPVVQTMFASVDRERLLRAANQYRLALESWKLGRESLSIAHLWMAVEALTKVQIRQSMAAENVSTPRDLAARLGVDLRDLDAIVRKKLLLGDDDECYQKAREASDGFEHGYLGYETIRAHAEAIRHRAAGYVRTSIFRLAGVPELAMQSLLQSPYDKPVGYWPLAKYLRGTLLGRSNNLAAAGSAYPFMKWHPVVTACSLGSDGRLQMTSSETFTAELGEGIEYKQTSYEVWEPG
jgi:hypothetical protein